MAVALYTIGVLALTVGLVVFSYLDRVYRELGRATTGVVHDHLDVFEAEIEPRLRLDRERAGASFSLLSRLWLVLVAAQTARGVTFFVPGTWEAAVEMILFLSAEVILAMEFVPRVLLVRTSGRWLEPVLAVVRAFVWLIWPVQAVLELFTSLLHLSEESESEPRQPDQQGIEALVEAATEEGILEQDEARLIEQVVEFSDKRVRDVMTPRPEVVAILAGATLEQLRSVLVKTKFSRLPAYEKNLDDIIGVVVARDILGVPEREAPRRMVRELARPALFVPETKLGSELLKEMQRKSQQMAIVIDEYGQMAGIVTVEDLVEEIVGEIGEEDRPPVPDILREPSGGFVLRGSVAVEKLPDLFGAGLDQEIENEGATTLAGLLNTAAGHVPKTGEIVDYGGLRFEVLEANQRKVLRLRARRLPGAAAQAQTM